VVTRLGRWLLPLVAGCLLPTLAGASTTAPSATAAGSVRYLSLTARVELDGVGITLRPPSQQAAPLISGPQAFHTCATGDSLCDPARTPDVYLALAEKPDSGMSGQLVWVIDYPGLTCLPFGIPPAGTADPALLKRLLTPYRCRLLNLVDSNTGRTLWSVRVGQ
jgi:hypothetical protein